MRRLKTSFTPEKVLIYMVFVYFQFCVAKVDCFVCLHLYKDIRCSPLVNTQVSVAIDQTIFFVLETSLAVFVFIFDNKNKNLGRLTKTSTLKRLVLHLTEFLTFHCRLQRKSTNCRLFVKFAKSQFCI